MQSVNLPKAVKVVLIVRLEGVTKQDGDVELCEAKVRVVQLCLTLCNPMDYTVHGILQATILEVGSLSLLQGIFPTQGSNPGLPPCRRILYQLSHKGSPREVELYKDDLITLLLTCGFSHALCYWQVSITHASVSCSVKWGDLMSLIPHWGLNIALRKPSGRLRV